MMVKPGPTQAHDFSSNLSAMRHADAIIQDALDGKAVAPEMLAEARETFIGLLWNGQPATDGAVRNGIFVLYAKASDPADKAELIGHVFAAGGQSILEEITRFDSSTKLTPDELSVLQNSMDLPLPGKLKVVADMLAEEAVRQGRSNDSNLPGGRYPSPPDRFVMPTQEMRLKEEETAVPEGGPPDDPRAGEKLADPTVPDQARRRAAERLGDAAVPILKGMLSSASPGEREFAASLLIELGKTRQTARTVRDAMMRLETQPDTRRTAEFIRQTIENDSGGLLNDSRARERARESGLQDGWLRSVFNKSDSPSILKAAAGREAIAIPMGIRMLHEMRARAG
jgi:hypothetical protein